MGNHANCTWCDREELIRDMHCEFNKPYCEDCTQDNLDLIKAGATPFSAAGIAPGRKLPNGAIVIMFDPFPQRPSGVVLAMWEMVVGWEYVCWLVGPNVGCSLGCYFPYTADGLKQAAEKYKERLRLEQRRVRHGS